MPDEDVHEDVLDDCVGVMTLEWVTPLLPEEIAPDGDDNLGDSFRWKISLIKADFGIDIQFAAYPYPVDDKDYVLWRIGQGNPSLCLREKFLMFLEGIHQGADQMAGRTVA